MMDGIFLQLDILNILDIFFFASVASYPQKVDGKRVLWPEVTCSAFFYCLYLKDVRFPRKGWQLFSVFR